VPSAVTADHQLTATLAKDYRFAASPGGVPVGDRGCHLPGTSPGEPGLSHPGWWMPNAGRLTAQAIEIAVCATHRPLNLSAQWGVPRVTARFTGWRLLAKSYRFAAGSAAPEGVAETLASSSAGGG
jgi:hypothetical protein